MAEKSVRQEGYLRERYHYFHLKDTMGQERDFHFHDFDKIVILLSGKVEYLVEDENYALRPWDVLLIRHHAVHRANISREIPYERIIIYLDGGYINRAIPEVPLMDCFRTADLRGRRITPDGALRARLKSLLQEMEQASEDHRFGAQILCDTCLMQLLVHLGRAIPDRRDPERGEDRYDAKISLALTYIQEHLGTGLTVEQIAAHVHLSPYYFMRLFRTQTGSSVYSYILQNRLIRAAKSIRNGMPASEAALDSGFSDYSAFYRAFRKQFGTSPGRIRRPPGEEPGAVTLQTHGPDAGGQESRRQIDMARENG